MVKNKKQNVYDETRTYNLFQTRFSLPNAYKVITQSNYLKLFSESSLLSQNK